METTKFFLFKGLCPVRIPATWAEDPEKILWASSLGVQYVDFGANGGKSYAFSVDVLKPHEGLVPHYASQPVPRYEEIDPSSVTRWGTGPENRLYVEPFEAAMLFGASDHLIDLVPPAPLPEGEPLIYPPALLGGVEMDISTPIQYGWVPDSFAGAGLSYALGRAKDGRAMTAYLNWGGKGEFTPSSFSYEEEKRRLQGVSVMRPWDWMSHDQVDLSELIAAYKRREYKKQMEVPRYVGEAYAHEGMRFWYGFVREDGVAVLRYMKPLTERQILERQVRPGAKYTDPWSKRRIRVPKDRFINSWNEVYVLLVGEDEPRDSLAKEGDDIQLGNQWEELPASNRQRLRELQKQNVQ